MVANHVIAMQKLAGSLKLIIAQKRYRWRPEIAPFRTKTINFFRLVNLNWLAKILIEGINIIANCSCMRDCCTPKMLKETEETIRFVSSFLSSVTFQLRGAGPPGYTYGFMITRQVCSHTKQWNTKFGITKLLKNIYRNRNTTQHQKELL